MIDVGDALASEERAPDDLVRYARSAEETGFTFALIDGFTFALIDDLMPRRREERSSRA